MDLPPNVRLNEDAAYVEKLKNVMAKNGGYCPCMVEKTPDTKCMCKDFRDQKEPGPCHCGRYEKYEEV